MKLDPWENENVAGWLDQGGVLKSWKADYTVCSQTCLRHKHRPSVATAKHDTQVQPGITQVPRSMGRQKTNEGSREVNTTTHAKLQASCFLVLWHTTQKHVHCNSGVYSCHNFVDFDRISVTDHSLESLEYETTVSPVTAPSKHLLPVAQAQTWGKIVWRGCHLLPHATS